jgi:hypothetical protein
VRISSDHGARRAADSRHRSELKSGARLRGRDSGRWRREDDAVSSEAQHGACVQNAKNVVSSNMIAIVVAAGDSASVLRHISRDRCGRSLGKISGLDTSVETIIRPQGSAVYRQLCSALPWRLPPCAPDSPRDLVQQDASRGRWYELSTVTQSGIVISTIAPDNPCNIGLPGVDTPEKWRAHLISGATTVCRCSPCSPDCPKWVRLKDTRL